MDNAIQNVERRKAERRKRSPFAWAVGWFFFVVLMGLLIFYFGFTNKFNEVTGSDSTRPTASESQPAK
jgi:hypothetical protein